MSAALEVLLADGVIDEVLGRLKSGKEADISLIRRGDDVLAAKVYKDRATRSFKNNADYKEGRKVRNTRTQRAMDSGGKFGRDAAEQEWKSAEADALYKLVGSGVRVPQPVMFYEGVLLMELVKDAEGRPAPRLIDVAIEPAAAMSLYADLLVQMISMLCCDLIHGDLSPYNILAAADGPTIIDFPQVVSAVHSSRAEFFFLRDFDNVVRFVSSFDPALAIHRHDGRAIWRAYVARELTREFVPPPPPPPQRGGGFRDRRPDDRGGQGRGPREGGPPEGRGGPRDGGNRPNGPSERPAYAQDRSPQGDAQGGNRPGYSQDRNSQGGNRPSYGQGNRPTSNPQGGNRPTSNPQGGNRPTSNPQGGNRPTSNPQGGNRPTSNPQGGNRPTSNPQGGNRPQGGNPQGGNRPPGSNRYPQDGNRPNGPSYSQGSDRPSYSQGSDRPSYAQGSDRPSHSQDRPQGAGSDRSGYAQGSDRPSHPQDGNRPSYASGNRPDNRPSGPQPSAPRPASAPSQRTWTIPSSAPSSPPKSKGGRRRPKRHW